MNIKQKDSVAVLQSKGIDICNTSMSHLEGQDFEVLILAEALGYLWNGWLGGRKNKSSRFLFSTEPSQRRLLSLR